MSQLIDTGASARGASYYGKFLQCRQLFAYQYRLAKLREQARVGPNGEALTDYQVDKLLPADALTMGSMFHTFIAHGLCKQGAVQAQQGKLPWGGVLTRIADADVWITDPDEVLDPAEAVRMWCEVYGRGFEFVEQMHRLGDAYFARHPEPLGLVVGVECPLTAVVGWKQTDVGDVWGLWVVDYDAASGDAPETCETLDRTSVVPDLLDAPGHPDHGRPVFLTKAADAVFLDPWRDCRASIFDWKTKSDVSEERNRQAYKADLGFGAYHHLGAQAFAPGANWLGGGGLGGVYAGLVQKPAPHRTVPLKIPLARSRDEMLPRTIWEAAHEIARLDLETMRGERTYWEWGMVHAESGMCMGRYGPCGGFSLCYDE